MHGLGKGLVRRLLLDLHFYGLVVVGLGLRLELLARIVGVALVLGIDLIRIQLFPVSWLLHFRSFK